jgi:superoxide dismutase
MDVYPDGFVKDYAEAFLANVNWYEIADNLAELTA